VTPRHSRTSRVPAFNEIGGAGFCASLASESRFKRSSLRMVDLERPPSGLGQGSGAAAQAHFQAHWQHPKCEVFPDAFRSARPFDVEIPVEHREQHLHLEQGETAAGTKARTRTKRNVRRYVVRAGVFAEPAPGPEGLGLDEVIRIARRRTRENKHPNSYEDNEGQGQADRERREAGRRSRRRCPKNNQAPRKT
jgi:hypothetical protein